MRTELPAQFARQRCAQQHDVAWCEARDGRRVSILTGLPRRWGDDDPVAHAPPHLLGIVYERQLRRPGRGSLGQQAPRSAEFAPTQLDAAATHRPESPATEPVRVHRAVVFYVEEGRVRGGGQADQHGAGGLDLSGQRRWNRRLRRRLELEHPRQWLSVGAGWAGLLLGVHGVLTGAARPALRRHMIQELGGTAKGGTLTTCCSTAT